MTPPERDRRVSNSSHVGHGPLAWYDHETTEVVLVVVCWSALCFGSPKDS